MRAEMTLKEEMDIQSSEEKNERIRHKLMLVHMLSNVQCNLMNDIKEILQEGNDYRFDIKHNHKKIMAFIRETAMPKFFDKISAEATDLYMDDYEELERMIYDWADGHETKSYDGKI